MVDRSESPSPNPTTGESVTEWHLNALSMDGFALGLGILGGVGAITAGIYILAAGGPGGFGVLFSLVGVGFLCLNAWLYWFAGIWHVYEQQVDHFRFVGPRRDLVVVATDVWSITGWRWDYLWPVRVRTAAGRFFLPRDLAGPSNFVQHLRSAGGIEHIDAFPQL